MIEELRTHVPSEFRPWQGNVCHAEVMAHWATSLLSLAGIAARAYRSIQYSLTCLAPCPFRCSSLRAKRTRTMPPAQAGAPR